MNANEARLITVENQKSMQDIYASIDTMAKAGYNYTAFDVKKIREPEDYKKILETEGYKVTINSTFLIEW